MSEFTSAEDVLDPIAVADDSRLFEVYWNGLERSGAVSGRFMVELGLGERHLPLREPMGDSEFARSMNETIGPKAASDAADPSGAALPNWLEDRRMRRALVAMTWPARFEEPIQRAALADRIGAIYEVTLTTNLIDLGWRWWHSRSKAQQPGGAPIDLLHAATVLGPTYGVPVSALGPVSGDLPILLFVDELRSLIEALKLTYADMPPRAVGGGTQWPMANLRDLREGRWTAPEIAADASCVGPGRGRWWLDDEDLALDMQLEQKLTAYRAELRLQLKEHAPDKVHALRVRPYGAPPATRSRYFTLFSWLDMQTAGSFECPINVLADVYAGRHPDVSVGSGAARGLSPRELPATALTTPGWWSTPKSISDGVGRQPQRIAWLAAGYRAKALTERSGSDSTRVMAVRFSAVPGREQWHPFRERLRFVDDHPDEDFLMGFSQMDLPGPPTDVVDMGNGSYSIPWFLMSGNPASRRELP